MPKSFTTGPITPCPFPTVTAAIRHATRNYPASVAAIDLSQADDRREIQYWELETRAQWLAHRLRAAGVEPGHRVPLVVKRSIEMLVGIYAVLLCGAQYVPLDGGVVAQAALETVISQSGGGLVVCTRSARKRLQKTDSDTVRGCRLLCIEDEAQSEGQEAVDSINLATPESGCYVIYTSGSWKACRRVCGYQAKKLTLSQEQRERPKGLMLRILTLPTCCVFHRAASGSGQASKSARF